MTGAGHHFRPDLSQPLAPFGLEFGRLVWTWRYRRIIIGTTRSSRYKQIVRGGTESASIVGTRQSSSKAPWIVFQFDMRESCPLIISTLISRVQRLGHSRISNSKCVHHIVGTLPYLCPFPVCCSNGNVQGPLVCHEPMHDVLECDIAPISEGN